MKDAIDLATSADLDAEKLIISLIEQKYPEHSIYSEEIGFIDKKSDFLWIIDPLDGTKEYVRGLSEYNCLVAVEKRDQLLAAALYLNESNDLYSVALGNGAEMNSKKIRVSPQSDLLKSFIGFHLPVNSSKKEKVDRSLDVLRMLVYKTYRVRPDWNDAKIFAYVARGIYEAHILPSNECLPNKWHDLVSGLLLVEEAGGKVTDWSGNPIKNHNLTNGIIASNGKIHDNLLKIVKA